MVPSYSPGYHSEHDMPGEMVRGLRHGDAVFMRQNLPHTDNNENVYVRGILVLESKQWYVCHNDSRFDGNSPINKLGYKYGWAYGRNISSYIKNGEIIDYSKTPDHTHGDTVPSIDERLDKSKEKEDKEKKKDIDGIVGYFLNRSLTK